MIKTSKKYPIHFDDKRLEELDFCARVSHCISDNTTAPVLQSRVREIIYRYGWNPARYPSYVSYTFWSLITGDSFGRFKKAIINQKTETLFDPSDENVVKW